MSIPTSKTKLISIGKSARKIAKRAQKRKDENKHLTRKMHAALRLLKIHKYVIALREYEKGGPIEQPIQTGEHIQSTVIRVKPSFLRREWRIEYNWERKPFYSLENEKKMIATIAAEIEATMTKDQKDWFRTVK
jgi:hypothetical protein